MANKSAALSAVFLRSQTRGEIAILTGATKCPLQPRLGVAHHLYSRFRQVFWLRLFTPRCSSVSSSISARCVSFSSLLFFTSKQKQNFGLPKDTTDIFWTRHFLDTMCLKGFQCHITVIKLKCQQTRILLPLLPDLMHSNACFTVCFHVVLKIVFICAIYLTMYCSLHHGGEGGEEGRRGGRRRTAQTFHCPWYNDGRDIPFYPV